MRYLAVLLVVAGCGKSKEECRTEAHALGSLLATADVSPSLMFVDDKDMHLVERGDLPNTQPRYAPVVNIGATTTYQGQTVTTPELTERLTAAHAKIMEDIEQGRAPRYDPPDPRDLVFVIDAKVPWPRVVETVAAATQAGMTAPMFVFGSPNTAKPPPRAPIDDELDAITSSNDGNAATKLAKLTSRLVKGCPSMIKVFGEVSSTEGGDKARFIAEAIPQALIDCNCNVDLRDFRSVMWRLLANPHPVRALRFDPDAPATTITAGASATWKDAAARFTADVKNATLVVE